MMQRKIQLLIIILFGSLYIQNIAQTGRAQTPFYYQSSLIFPRFPLSFPRYISCIPHFVISESFVVLSAGTDVRTTLYARWNDV